jgi:transposase
MSSVSGPSGSCASGGSLGAWRKGGLSEVARQLGISTETLRKWVKQAAIDDGLRPGTTTTDKARIAALEREVRELRRANEILKSAAVFFGAELDRRSPK